MQGPFNAALAQAAGGAVMVPSVAEWLTCSLYPKPFRLERYKML